MRQLNLNELNQINGGHGGTVCPWCMIFSACALLATKIDAPKILGISQGLFNTGIASLVVMTYFGIKSLTSTDTDDGAQEDE